MLKNKNGEVNNIHAKTLKMIAPKILDPLVHITNLMSNAECPDHFKLADVIPVFK